MLKIKFYGVIKQKTNKETNKETKKERKNKEIRNKE